MTNYLSIFKDKVTKDMKERIFNKFEKLGYTLIIKDSSVGPKGQDNIWVAQKGENIILYNCSCFKKICRLQDVFFTEEEYNIIKEA